jgi:hypothetical protein
MSTISARTAAYLRADPFDHSERITSMKTVFVLNDPSYGTELADPMNRCWISAPLTTFTGC